MLNLDYRGIYMQFTFLCSIGDRKASSAPTLVTALVSVKVVV